MPPLLLHKWLKPTSGLSLQDGNRYTQRLPLLEGDKRTSHPRLPEVAKPTSHLSLQEGNKYTSRLPVLVGNKAKPCLPLVMGAKLLPSPLFQEGT